jgi:hypothetical protein
MEEFFFSKERFTRLSSIRLAYFLLFVFFFLLTETGRGVYRPFIYGNQINDFGLADVVGNLLGTVAIIFFNLTIVNAARMQSVRIIVFVTAGVMIYELLQAVLPRGVLDWKDVWSTPIAGIFSLLMVFLVWRRIPDSLAVSEAEPSGN